MVRQMIQIDEKKCNGCGICVNACHESALGIVDGKAKLLRDDYCDGMGDCLPECPMGAISFIEREAAAYDEAAVMENKKKKLLQEQSNPAKGCPGLKIMTINRDDEVENTPKKQAASSQLKNWPVQIKLAPPRAPYFHGANLLIAADCTAYAYADFHQDFIKGKIALIGCPKLDQIDYSEKLAAIMKSNEIASVTVVRMEVPCCGGLERAVKKALLESGKLIPCQVVTISNDGKRLDGTQMRELV